MAHLSEEFVAPAVAVCVVDILEVVEIHEQHGNHPSSRLRSDDCLTEELVEQNSVGQPSELVVVCLVMEESFAFLAIGDVSKYSDNYPSVTELLRVPMDFDRERRSVLTQEQIEHPAGASVSDELVVNYLKPLVALGPDYCRAELEELLAGVAEHRACRGVDLDDTSRGAVNHDDRLGSCVHGHSESLEVGGSFEELFLEDPAVVFE